MKCTHVCAAQTTYYLTLNQIINRTDFPSLADEIAEPRPDMNIKAIAFTMSKTSYYTTNYNTHSVSHLYKIGNNSYQ